MYVRTCEEKCSLNKILLSIICFCRDVLFVQEPMLVVPKLYCSIPTCMLRVVDNDTGEEVPRVFQRVAPYEYKKNRVRILHR